MAIALMSLGWVAGRAQTSQPDFELLVDGPAGETRVACVRGCRLSWVERGLNPTAQPTAEFRYGCRGSERCSSGRLGGWMVR